MKRLALAAALMLGCAHSPAKCDSAVGVWAIALEPGYGTCAWDTLPAYEQWVVETTGVGAQFHGLKFVDDYDPGSVSGTVDENGCHLAFHVEGVWEPAGQTHDGIAYTFDSESTIVVASDEEAAYGSITMTEDLQHVTGSDFHCTQLYFTAGSVWPLSDL